MDGSLVIWGDVEDTTLGFWREIIWRIQSPAIPTTTSVAGPSVYSGFNPDGTTLGNELSGLDEFFNLSTFADLPPGPWGADCEATTSTHFPLGCQRVTSAPSEGSLGVCVSALCAYDILSPLSSCSLRSLSVHIRLSAMPPPPLAWSIPRPRQTWSILFQATPPQCILAKSSIWIFPSPSATEVYPPLYPALIAHWPAFQILLLPHP